MIAKSFMDLGALPILQVLSATDLKKHPECALATRLDWRKVPRILSGEYPKPTPKAHLIGADRQADIAWYKEALKAKYLVFDVETEKLQDGTYSGKIIQVGMYPASGKPAIWDRVLYPEFNFPGLFRKLVEVLPAIAHNTPFDVSRIWDNFGITVWEYRDLHDTILMHHILYPEFPHRLEFIASIYSELSKLKHLGVGNYDYLVGDVVSTAEAYEAMTQEFESDQQSYAIYNETLRILMRFIIHFMHHGVPVNADFVQQSLEWIPNEMQEALNVAQAYAGYPIKLDGPQLKVVLEEIEDVFASAKKLLGFTVSKELTDKGETSFDKETMTSLRSAWVPVDHNEELTSELMYKRIEQGAHPFLEAKALWNRTRILMSNYVKPLLVPLVEQDGQFFYEGSLHVGDGAPQLRYLDIEEDNNASS